MSGTQALGLRQSVAANLICGLQTACGYACISNATDLHKATGPTRERTWTTCCSDFASGHRRPAHPARSPSPVQSDCTSSAQIGRRAFAGEGKSLTGILPAYLNVLTGHTVYIATVNDYLAKRDRDYFDTVFKLLAIEVCATAVVPACAMLVVEVLTCAAQHCCGTCSCVAPSCAWCTILHTLRHVTLLLHGSLSECDAVQTDIWSHGQVKQIRQGTVVFCMASTLSFAFLRDQVCMSA